MATIMSVGNSEGTRRCDNRCHEAKPGTHCDCICGGRYHASGSSARAAEMCATDVRAGRWGEGLAEAAIATDAEIRGQAEHGVQETLDGITERKAT